MIPEGNTVGKTLLGKLNAQRNWFNKKYKAAKGAAELLESCKNQLAVDEAKAALADVRDQLEKCRAKFEELSDHMRPLLQDEIETHADNTETWYRIIQKRILEGVTAANQPPTPSLAAAPAGAAAAGNGTAKSKLQPSLQPPKLALGATLTEVQSWVLKFKAYFTMSQLENESNENRQEVFYMCLEDNLENTIRYRGQVNQDTPVFGEAGSLLSALLERFQLLNPLFSSCMSFFNCTQPKGTQFTDWMATLEQAARFAELSQIKIEDLIVFQIIRGTTNQELKSRFLKLKEPTLKDLKEEAMQYEIGQRTLRSCNQGNPNQVVTKQIKGLEGRCSRCGSSKQHEQGQQCPAKDKKCNNCGKLGHFATARDGTQVCQSQNRGRMGRATSHRPSRSSSPAGSDRSDISESGDRSSHRVTTKVVRVMRLRDSPVEKIHSLPTPTFQCTLESENGAFEFNCTPDTGATRSVMAWNLVKRFGLTKDMVCTEQEMKTANGASMCTEGDILLMVTNLSNNKKKQMQLVVTKDFKDEILISWHDLVDLGVLHENFPNHIEQNKPSKEDDVAQIKEEFANDLSNTLESKTAVLGGARMTNHLREDPSTKHLQLSKKRLMAGKLMEKLDKGRVPAKVSGTITRANPAKFAPEPKGGVRLNPNFRHLIDDQPVTPSTKELEEFKPPPKSREARCFMNGKFMKALMMILCSSLLNDLINTQLRSVCLTDTSKLDGVRLGLMQIEKKGTPQSCRLGTLQLDNNYKLEDLASRANDI